VDRWDGEPVERSMEQVFVPWTENPRTAHKEVFVKSSNGCRWALLLLPLLLFGIAAPGIAGEPTDQMKQTTDKVLSILNDPALKGPSKTEQRERLIRKALDERFDWEEMARRSLAKHWSQRTEEEKKEFVRLYTGLVERTYIDKIVEGYSGEKIIYEGENIEKDYGTVKVKIVTKKETNIPVEYRLRTRGDKWLIYDVSIEGVSLVNNYRTQFDSIMVKFPYANLVKRLKDKVNEK
jgi:phospholipid transport system substrate-binding protein